MDKPLKIKFRGKRVDNGEWAYGHYMFDCFGHGYILFKGDSDRSPTGFSMQKVEVIPETVSQYTNFNTRDGEEIFDGDQKKTLAVPVA